MKRLSKGITPFSNLLFHLTRIWLGSMAWLVIGCMPVDEEWPKIESTFEDTFDRERIGGFYTKMGGTWEILDGALRSQGDENIPIWLNRQLPKNVRIELTAWSESTDVDLKIELFGDGRRHESGYSIIFGGWKNTLTVIARRGEHEKKRKVKRTRWKRGHKYRWRIERRDENLDFYVDDVLQVSYRDSMPLYGSGHDRMGFTNWRSDARLDDLKITALSDDVSNPGN